MRVESVWACCSKMPTHYYGRDDGRGDLDILGVCDAHHPLNDEGWKLLHEKVVLLCVLCQRRDATRFFHNRATGEFTGYCEQHREEAVTAEARHARGKWRIVPVNEDEWPVLDVMES